MSRVRELQKLQAERLHQRSNQMLLDKTDQHISQLKSEADKLFTDLQDLIYKNETKNVADISKLQGFKSNPIRVSDATNKVVASLLIFLRENPQHLSNSFNIKGWIDPKHRFQAEMARVSRILVCSLFRHCYNTTEELHFLNLVQCVINLIPEQTTSFPEFLLELFNAYIRYTSSLEYLEIILKDTLFQIIEKESNAQDQVSEYSITRYDEAAVTDNVDKILKQILSDYSVETMPFGIRLFVKLVHKKYQNSEKCVQLLKQFVFDNMFTRCLLHPDLYVGVRGIRNVRAEYLSRVAKKFNEKVYTLPEVNEYILKIANFQDEEMPLLGEKSHFPCMYITKSDFELVLSFISPLQSQNVLSCESIDSALESLNINTPTDFRKIHIRELLRVSLDIKNPPMRVSTQNDKIVRTVKSKLFQVLSNSISAKQWNVQSLDQLLNNACKCWYPNQASTLAQIKEVIRSLSSLPEAYKENHYEMLIAEMLQDSEDRKSDVNAEVDSRLAYLSELQVLQKKLSYFVQALIELFSHKKISVPDYMNQFVVAKKSFLREFAGLKEIEQKTNHVKNFMESVIKMTREHELFTGASKEEIMITVKLLERSVMNYIYENIYVSDSKDADLLRKLNTVKDVQLSLEDFEIPAKFHSGAPWPLAQAELLKLNKFRAPYDKYMCISWAWEIIGHYVSLLDDPAPDALWPIMAWCLYTTSVRNLVANANYIRAFTTLTDREEARLEAFNTAIEVLHANLDYYMEKNNIVLDSSPLSPTELSKSSTTLRYSVQ